jgi:NADH-quinone oxidoreductase subunit L
MSHVHESPRVMTVPLIVLAAGSVLAGWLGYSAFVGDGREAFWGASIFVLAANDTVELAHHVPSWVKILPIIVAVSGIGLAYVMYIVRPDLPALVTSRIRPVYLFVHNKWYFDELYNAVFVRPASYLGNGLWRVGDGAVIDGIGPDGIAATTRDLARRASRLQTGYLYHYAFVMLIGVVAFITWYLFTQIG